MSQTKSLAKDRSMTLFFVVMGAAVVCLIVVLAVIAASMWGVPEGLYNSTAVMHALTSGS